MEGSRALDSGFTPLGQGIDPDGQLGSSNRPPFLGFVGDPASEQLLREVFTEAQIERFEIRKGDIEVACAHLSRNPTPQVLLVDIGGTEQPVAALDRLADFCEPDTRVLVVGDRDDLAFYREVTKHLGVTEYLFKPLTKEMVSRHFLPHIVPQPGRVEGRVRGGRVVTVSGARGGVGATTVAVNLAQHLAAETRRHIVLVDLNLHTGSAALMLGAKPGNGLRLAIEAPEKVDGLFLDRASVQVNDRLALLTCEEKLTESPLPVADAPTRLIQLLCTRYNYVIVDLPHLPGRMQRAAFDLAHQRVLVMAPDLASVRDTLRFHALPNAPQQSRPAVVVLNQLGLPGTLSRGEVEKGLGFAVDVAVPYLPKVIPDACNMGTPAVGKAGPFRDAISGLAREVAAVRGEAAARERRGLFARLRR